MLPAISVFGHTVALYGLMILLGGIAGVLVAIYLGYKLSIKREDIIFSYLYGAIGLIVGAKILYLLIEMPWIIDNMDLLIQNPEYILSLFTGGFVFYGGLIGGLIMMHYYCRKYHVPMKDMLSVIIPAVPLVHAFGRLGCFFAGCCYGIHYEGPFSITFTRSGYAPNDVPLFPVQLMESAVNLLIFLILFFTARKKKQPGKILSLYLLMYSVMRFFMEFLRGDAVRGIFFGLSISQWVSILLFISGILLITRKPKKIVETSNI